MTRIGLLFFCLLMPAMTTAQDLPALFNVTGVANNDVLNIRSGPGAQYPIVGSLAPNASGVEIVARSDNGWGSTNAGEGSGWVSMRYLARAPQAPWWSMGQPLTCFGTEPFWDLAITPHDITMVTAEGITLSYPPGWNATPLGRPSLVAGFGTAGADGISGVVRAESCDDGMSDREFGLAVDVFLHQGGNAIGYSGCCSVSQ